VKLTIWGKSNSRTSRPLWAAEECGVAYEHNPVDPREGETGNDAYLALNPSGKIPALSDAEGVGMFESFAMCVYIAQTYGAGSLWPDSKIDQAKCLQWAFWAACEFEKHPIGIIVQHAFFAEADRDQDAIKAHMEGVKPYLELLEGELAGKAYLCGDDFTVADLCVGAVGEYLSRVDYDLTAYPNTQAWLSRVLGRSAYKRVGEIRAAELAASQAAQ